LLGVVRDGRSQFFSVSDMDQLSIPRDYDEYVLHPCVIDAVEGARPIGNQIVYPYLRD
jgi:hypothetical protein